MGAVAVPLLLAALAARGVLPGMDDILRSLEGVIKGMDAGGAGGAGAAPPEAADAAKRRVGREYDTAVKECERASKALQQRWHAADRAQAELAKAELAVSAAEGAKDKKEADMRRLWGDDADERMGGNGGEELDQQVAAGVFAPVVGRDIGEFWPEGEEGARTPGRDIYDEGLGREEDADPRLDDAMPGGKEAEEWAERLAQDHDGEEWAQDMAGEGGAEESGGGRKGGAGGVGGLLGKGMGGKGGGKASGAAVGMVNATIRKPA